MAPSSARVFEFSTQTYTSPELAIRCEVAEGSPAETIVGHVARENIDLLILTRYGRGHAETFAVGGTAQKVVSSANCSVLLLDPRRRLDSENQYHRILVPVDGGKNSDCAVAVATMIAEIHGASLLLAYIIEEPRLPERTPATQHTQTLTREIRRITRFEAERRLNQIAATIPKHVAVDKRTLVSSDPPFAIESLAEEYDCDLLILHTIGTGTDQHRSFGTMNQSLIQYSHRPLFVLRPAAAEGFTSNFRSVYLEEPQLEAG